VLPTFILDEVQETKKQLDDGRIRTFPHVPGNYAAHFFIKVPASSISDTSSIISAEATRLQKDLNAMDQDQFHISLSRTFPMRHHQIQLFIEMVEKKFQELNPARFSASLGSFSYFHNDEKTRCFLSINVTEGKNEMVALIRIIDSVLREFGFPVFYLDAQPHVSIAWLLSLVPVQIPNKIEEIDLPVTHFSCKIGQHVYEFKLA